ncbi:hypothetical protein ACIQOV_22055 [Kitasatospora sp. NPDC091257]|uniref:hypothetical protein n=1 Tax=Kitasatospora sp. NPDC091257 TaxID=3364084 RepID=UPI00380A27E2
MTSTASHSATAPNGRPGPGGASAAPEGALPAGAGPWSVRSAGSGRGRAALELYQYGELTDVLVAARLTPHLLRGARHCPSTGRNRYVLAWGRLAADGVAPAVVFTGRRPFRRARSTAEVAVVADRFWIAWAEGPFDAVRVEHSAGGTAERLPLERVRGIA